MNFNFNDFQQTQAFLSSLLEDPRKMKQLNKEEEKCLRRIIRKRYRQQSLKPYQAELIKLQHYLGQKKIPMIILFEGRDASAKSGTIRRIIRYMNPKHYRVIAPGQPTERQKTQWYFQRYAAGFPAGGEMALFDRGWYTRALTEPVFGFCSEDDYQAFMYGVTGFEKDLIRQGIKLVKFYFSVSRETQAKRFAKRQQNPLKKWKLSEIDLQAQEHWNDFTEMKWAMLKKTHTPIAPWTIIRSDCKYKARINAIKVILNSVDYTDRDLSLDTSVDPEIVIAGDDEIETMKKQMEAPS